MKKVIIVLADGFEEIEAINTIDILRRATIEVDIIAMNDLSLTGAHGITINADDVFNYYSLLDYDAIIFAGGMDNARILSDNSSVLELINYYKNNDKLICGICASPAIIFSKTNILNGKKFTCYKDDSLISLVENGEYQDKSVVVDDNLITSQSPYTSMAFALTIANKLGYDIDALQKALKG